MDRSLLLALVVVVLVFVVLPRLGTISGAEARRRVSEGALLVDVRTKAEFDAGHIPGARHVPLDAIGARASELVGEGKPVVVYCASGVRSAAAKRALKRAGLTDVHNLGAMSRW